MKLFIYGGIDFPIVRTQKSLRSHSKSLFLRQLPGFSHGKGRSQQLSLSPSPFCPRSTNSFQGYHWMFDHSLSALCTCTVVLSYRVPRYTQRDAPVVTCCLYVNLVETNLYNFNPQVRPDGELASYGSPRVYLTLNYLRSLALGNYMYFDIERMLCSCTAVSCIGTYLATYLCR